MKNYLLFAAVILLLNVQDLGAQTISTFEDLSLPADSFWNGADTSGGFISGNAFFGNYYNSQWGSWAGWSYSSKTDSITAGFANEYSAIAGSGAGSATYATAYVSSFGGSTFISLRQLARGKVVNGFSISNSTYAYYSMHDGDAYGKKFGGLTGNDPDWFRLKVTGYLDGIQKDTVDFYLADFRDSVNSNDFILKNWSWVDLTALGPIDSLTFILSSSDNGSWGMNTPAYFCIDNLTTSDGVGMKDQNAEMIITVFPNPSTDFLKITSTSIIDSYSIFDISGRSIKEMKDLSANRFLLDVSGFAPGLYLIRMNVDGNTFNSKFIKN